MSPKKSNMILELTLMEGREAERSIPADKSERQARFKTRSLRTTVIHLFFLKMA